MIPADAILAHKNITAIEAWEESINVEASKNAANPTEPNEFKSLQMVVCLSLVFVWNIEFLNDPFEPFYSVSFAFLYVEVHKILDAICFHSFLKRVGA